MMSNLDKVLDDAMSLTIEQQEMLIQILQRRMIEQRRDEIAEDAKLSLADFQASRLKIQTASEAIAELREFTQQEE